MKRIIFMGFTLFFTLGCKSQSDNSNPRTIVGGPCEGCEAIYEYGDRYLSSSDTLPGYSETEPKLHITGTIYQSDGHPASDVILYIYHTNREGIYETLGEERGWGKRHGSIRGWIKTGDDGSYAFYTFRPASYPNRDEPEHIHLTVKEPDINEYYIDDIVFDDDPLLTKEKRSRLNNRGGSGIIIPIEINKILHIQRDIFLGKNIPGYQ